MKHKKLTALLAVLAVSALGVGALSYYSGTAQKKQNDFNIVAGQKDQNDAGTIQEPAQENGGKADAAAGLQPDQIVPKDPYIVSNVDQSAWAIMKVEVPKFTEAPNAGKSAAELLNVNADGKQKLLRELDDAEKHTVVYGYTEPLAGNNSTKPEAERARTSSLFDSFKITGDISLANTYTGVIRVSGTLLQTEGHATVDDAFIKNDTNNSGNNVDSVGETAIFADNFRDFNITSINRVTDKPSDDFLKNCEIISTDDSDVPIYQQAENHDIYWYSEATHLVWGPQRIVFGGTKITNLNCFKDLDISNVIYMDNAFALCRNLTDISALSSWDVSNVTNMSHMFYDTQIADLSAINDQNISNVTDFTEMCKNSTSHPEFTKRAGTQDSNGTFIPST